MLEIARKEKDGKRGAFITDENNKRIPNPAIVKILQQFSYQCISTNVTRITEWHTTPREYLQEYIEFLNKGIAGQ